MNAKYYSDKGLEYLENGDFNESIGYFKKAIEIDPKDPKCGIDYFNIGCAYFYMGYISEALKQWSIAKKHGDETANQYLRIYDIITSNRIVECYIRFIQLMKQFNHHPCEFCKRSDGLFYANSSQTLGFDKNHKSDGAISILGVCLYCGIQWDLLFHSVGSGIYTANPGVCNKDKFYLWGDKYLPIHFNDKYKRQWFEDDSDTD